VCAVSVVGSVELSGVVGMAQHRASLTTTLRRHDVMLRLVVSLLIAASQLGAVSHAQTTRESISRLPALAARCAGYR